MRRPAFNAPHVVRREPIPGVMDQVRVRPLGATSKRPLDPRKSDSLSGSVARFDLPRKRKQSVAQHGRVSAPLVLTTRSKGHMDSMDAGAALYAY